MQYALTQDTRTRIEAKKDQSAICPLCQTPVIAKCGSIVIHHWAHQSLKDCDPWWEPETEWHRTWKAKVPPERTEVTIQNHRADIVRTDGTVIELQHSTISPEDIKSREQTYQKMIWLFDGRDISRSGITEDERKEEDNLFRLVNAQQWEDDDIFDAWLAQDKFENYDEYLWTEIQHIQLNRKFNVGSQITFRKQSYGISFRWRHPRKSWAFCKQPIFVDLGNNVIFRIMKLHINDEPPYGGWGRLIERWQFDAWLKR